MHLHDALQGNIPVSCFNHGIPERGSIRQYGRRCGSIHLEIPDGRPHVRLASRNPLRRSAVTHKPAFLPFPRYSTRSPLDSGIRGDQDCPSRETSNCPLFTASVSESLRSITMETVRISRGTPRSTPKSHPSSEPLCSNRTTRGRHPASSRCQSWTLWKHKASHGQRPTRSRGKARGWNPCPAVPAQREPSPVRTASRRFATGNSSWSLP